MAKARMLHTKISKSQDVDKLSCTAAMLLYSWIIPHCDDDGRIRGEAKYIKATAIPMREEISIADVEKYLKEMQEIGLICRWQDKRKDEWYIQLPTWKKYQQLKKDRYKPSDLPTPPDDGNILEPIRTQTGTKSFPQSNVSKSNPNKNISESSRREREYEGKPNYVADKNIGETKKVFKIVYPDGFEPSNGAEVAAKEAWEKLEPNKPQAFAPTYLSAVKKGLPENLFYQFVSEIRQSPNIDNPGKVFNKKVKDYLAQQARE